MENYKYEIISKNSLTSDEENVIVQLYQPILGLNASQIYFSLFNEFNLMKNMPKSVFSQQTFAAKLGLNIKDLNKELKKLEGMKLIKSFKNDESKVITYELIKPIEPKEFFNNIMFNDVLKQKLGEERYEIEKVFYYSDAIDKQQKGMIETTCNFEEAFGLEFESFKNRDVYEQPQVVDQSLIDFSNLENLMKEANLDPSALNEKAKDAILANVTMDSYNEQELIKLIQQSYDEMRNCINLDTFRILLKDLVINKQTEQTNELISTKVKEMEEHDSFEYASLLMDGNVNRTVKNIITNLRKRLFGTKVPNDGMINCLLEYSY